MTNKETLTVVICTNFHKKKVQSGLKILFYAVPIKIPMLLLIQQGFKFQINRICLNSKCNFILKIIYRKNGAHYVQMAQNLLGNIPAEVIYRIDVDFRIQEVNLDSFIGRTAHIQFLECHNLMKMLIHRFKDFFP